MCLILNLVYLVSLPKQLPRFQVKTHFRINCRFVRFHFPVSFSRSLPSRSAPQRAAFLERLNIITQSKPIVNTFFEVFLSFFESFFKYRLIPTACCRSFAFLSTSCTLYRILPQLNCFDNEHSVFM